MKVLIVEDDPLDRELIVQALGQAGYAPDWRQVDTEAGYLTALAEGPELVLSDYCMPGFDGLRALELLKESRLDIPFILVSGTIGEDIAVIAMKNGAADYLLKDRLARLGPAVRQALHEGQFRRERQQVDEKLRASEERLRQLIENVSDIIAVVDPAGVIVYQSPSTQRVLGYQPAEVIGHPVMEFIHPEDREKALSGIQRAVAGQSAQEPLDYRMRHSDGTWRIFQSNGRAVTDPTGAARVVVTSHDITATRALEGQFLRAQRLEAIGTLSSGIAHDLNNILAPILLIASMLKESLSTPHDLEMLAMVEQSAQRGANIIKQLLTFSRGIEGERGPVQLRHLLKEMVGIMRETFPRDITILQQVAPDLAPVNADATQIHQVLMNLCVNARDAMPGGGKLTLAAQNVVIGEKQVAVEPLAIPGAFVCLTISDSGVGIPAANLVRMFEPFFTTKEIGKGTGLGLSTVLGIVKSHGGFVTVTSEPGRGTTFKVHLPSLGEQPVTVAPESLALPRGNQELILVVDDEASLRHALCLTLADANYRVLAAADGRQAMNLFLAHRSSIRLVLTDLMMPGISGLALIRTLRALEPHLRFVASSGLHDQGRRDELTALGVKSFLPKPSGPEEILRALHRELTPDPGNRGAPSPDSTATNR